MDDTFVVWPDGREKLNSFLTLINGIQECITFPMEVKQDGGLLFVGILFYHRGGGSLG